MKSFLINTILLLSGILGSSSLVAQDADVQDSLALVDLYNSTNGPGWTDNGGWLTGPVSNWDGVNLNGSGKVITLDLVANNLKGTLPASIKNLTAVVDFEMQDNQLTGTIPNLTGMAALNTFFLYGNQLTGTLPASIGTLTNLSQILVNNNKLSGPIPNLENLINLSGVEFENNQFTGSYPVMPSPGQLIIVKMSYNKLSGTLPANLGGTQMNDFEIDHNQFSGPLPAVFFTMVTNGMYVINFSNNQFAAPLNLNTAGDCENLTLDSNKFNFTGIEGIAVSGVIVVYAPQFPVIHVNYSTTTNLLSVSAGGTLANDSYAWYKDGLEVGVIAADSTFPATGCGKYWVQMSNALADKLTLYSDTFSISSTSSVSIVGSANNICSGANVTFTATPVNGGTTPAYQWKVNGNNVGTNSATFSSTSLANNDAVTVVLTTSDACALPAKATSNTITMVVNPSGKPTFSPTISGLYCQNSTAPALPGKSSENIAGTWSPATINTATAGASNYIFTPTGNPCAVSDTVSITITASQAPPTFSPSISGPYCQNSTAPALPGKSSENIAGTWSPAVINTATVGASNYIFTPSGGGSCSSPATVSITISSQVTPTFSPSISGPYCQNSTAPALPGMSSENIAGTWSPAVINTATVGASNYIFTPGGGGSCTAPATVSITISSKVTPTFSPSISGPYCQNSTAPALPAQSSENIAGTWSPAVINTSTLGASNYVFTPSGGGSCSAPATVSITISSQVTPTFSPSISGPYCQNSTAPALPAQSSENIAGTWSPAVINTSTLGASNYVFTPSGGGSCSAPATVSITISSKVTPTFSPSISGPYCQNSTAPALPAQSSENIAGTWSPATINTSTLGASNYVFTPSGGGSCSAPATVSITISSQVTPTFAAIVPVCQNATAPGLPGTSNQGISGSWSPATINTATVGSSDYTFTPSAGQCGTTAKVTVVIDPAPVVKTGADQTIQSGESVGLTATITGVTENEISSYLWTPADGLSNSTIVDPQASPAATTTYTLSVTSDGGCKGSGSTTITVQAGALPALGVPNVFSPNGDGINDTWVITNINYYPLAEVSVFNRYGQLVYQTQGDYKPWDGNYSGKKVPFGTYYYIIDTKTNTKKKSGSITILR